MLESNAPRRLVPAGVALIVIIGALLAGLLLNAEDILRTAERQEQGWQRTVGVAVMEPIAGVSDALMLSAPRDAIDSLLGRGSVAAPTPTATTQPTTAPITAPIATITVPETATRRQVTAGDPLTMYIGGDSMVGQFGPMLDNIVTESGLVEADFVYEFVSGLSRPDFLDWPARLEGVSAEMDPDVFVLYFGGNDAQAIYMPDGSWIEYGTPEWEAEYRARVEGVMAMLEGGGHWVYWMGLPIVQSASFQERVEFMNSIYADLAEDHPQVTFVEAQSVFEGPDGGYSEYLTDSNGDLVDMRLDDGVHYTTAGAIRLAEVVWPLIAADWGIGVE